MRRFLATCAATAFCALVTPPAYGDAYMQLGDEDGSTMLDWRIETGSLPAFVFTGTDIDAADARFFCSRSRGAVWAQIGGRLYAVSQAAAAGDLALGENGRLLPVATEEESTALFSSHPDVPVRILSQAQRKCDPQPMVVRAPDDDLGRAYKLCSAIDAAAPTTAPCEVSGWNRAVTASVDMSASRARAACREWARSAGQTGMHFTSRWTLQIRSPYSVEKTIAFCDLP